MSSIDHVIARMDAIVEECKEKSLRAGYFAVLYRFVTIRIKHGIESDEFDDGERMEQLDTIFAQRFFDAYDAYYHSADGPVTQSWKHAFDSAKSGSFIIMQHLLLGINAHINLDLGIAAAETMKGKDIELIHKDYDRVNAILASLVDDVTSNLSRVSLFFGPMIKLARGHDEMLVSFSIKVARDGAWEFAKSYSEAQNKEFAIRDRDEKIAGLARQLTNTGSFLTFIIKIIRFGEFRSLQNNMDQLAGIIE